MPPKQVEPFLAAARDYIERALTVSLDGSEESLAFVDHYIDARARRRDGEPITPEILELIAPALGAYFGEVAITKFGGRWVSEAVLPADWTIELEKVELRFSPTGMAAAALAGEEVAGYDASFTAGARFRGPLDEALTAAAPVDEAYFYSLTGRLEMLAQVVDLLTELQRRVTETTSEPESDLS